MRPRVHHGSYRSISGRDMPLQKVEGRSEHQALDHLPIKVHLLYYPQLHPSNPYRSQYIRYPRSRVAIPYL